VIEIEPAQEILVGLASARVLRDRKTGDDFHELTRAQDRAILKLRKIDAAFAGRPRHAD